MYWEKPKHPCGIGHSAPPCCQNGPIPVSFCNDLTVKLAPYIESNIPLSRVTSNAGGKGPGAAAIPPQNPASSCVAQLYHDLETLKRLWQGKRWNVWSLSSEVKQFSYTFISHLWPEHPLSPNPESPWCYLDHHKPPPVLRGDEEANRCHTFVRTLTWVFQRTLAAWSLIIFLHLAGEARPWLYSLLQLPAASRRRRTYLCLLPK